MNKLSILCIVLISALMQNTAYAAKCKAPRAAAEMSAEEMTTLYQCLQPKLAAAYGRKGDAVGSAYAGWKAASTRPAAPGVHSGQHLMTYVNEVGYDQYVEFRTDGSQMPVGTVIAKENFTIADNGKVKVGPLLIMTKIEGAEDTGGWQYTGLKRNGKPLKVDAKGFCHACHQAYPTQDFMGYPVPDVRAGI